MLIDLLLIFIVYLMLLILGSYYVNLYLSKDQFTKDELKAVLPYLKRFWIRILNNYSMIIMGSVVLISSFIGIALPLLADNWFFNSAVIFVALYLLFPLMRKNFEKITVTTGGSLSDTAINIIVKYYHFILIGFGVGTATALMYNWGAYKSLNFLWFIANFIILSILLGITINNASNQ